MRRGLPEPAGERIPNLAPMVDVIMVILVFFLLGASLELAAEGALQTELDPRSGPGEGAPVEIIPAVKIALEERGDGRVNIYVLGKRLPGDSFDDLHAFMTRRRDAGADTANPVVIAAQSGVRWRWVVRAMDVSIRAGFTNVQFAVSLAHEPGGDTPGGNHE